MEFRQNHLTSRTESDVVRSYVARLMTALELSIYPLC
jgi:hypothetical protein